jgi:hypothetical protein
MSEEAPELDEGIMGAVCEELRAHVGDTSEVDIASVAVDLIRAITIAGYSIRKIN